MSNEVVKYENTLNKINLNGLTEKEQDFYFSLIYKSKESNGEPIVIPFSELRELAGDTNRNIDRFIKNLDSLHKKIASQVHKIVIGNTSTTFVLFPTLKTDLDSKTVTISTNKDLLFIFNALNNFTLFELQEFVRLKKGYSKSIFRNLSQFKNTKKWIVLFEEFKNLLSIPKSYKMSDIDKQILIPAIEDLSQLKDFKNLQCEKIKKGGKKTGAVEKLIWTWSPDYQQSLFASDEVQKQEPKKEVIQQIIKKKCTLKEFEIIYNEYIKTEEIPHSEHFKKMYLARFEIIEEKAAKQEKELIPEPVNDFIDIDLIEVDVSTYKQLEKNHLNKFKNVSDDELQKIKETFRNKFEVINTLAYDENFGITEEDFKEPKENETSLEMPKEFLSKNGKKLVGGALKMAQEKWRRENEKH